MNFSLKRIFILQLIVCSSFTFGQVKQHLPLPSISYDFVDSVGINGLNTIISPPINIQNLQTASDALSLQTGNNYFGKGIPVDVDVKQTASHQSNYRGELYRLEVVLPNATFIQLHFDQFNLPPGAVLYFYNPQKTLFYGGYSQQNNRSTNKFATQPMYCDSIIIEYFEPINNNARSGTSSAMLHISKIIAGFRGVLASGTFGTAASCDINTTCSLGDGWENEASSLALILEYNDNLDLIAGGSGNLINNTAQDGTPYLLTANHLLEGSDPAYWIFMFHNDEPTCGGGGVVPTDKTISGAGTLENQSYQSSSDYALLLLCETPPKSYNVCYEGWDNTATDVTSNEPLPVIGISHPRSDASKIVDGYISSSPEQTSVLDGTTTYTVTSSDFWDVTWNQGDGFTEPGSSGSSVYDPNHHCVGTLTSASKTDDCNFYSNPADNFAWYGKFSQSWNDGSFGGYLDQSYTQKKTMDTYCPTGGYNPPDPSPCDEVSSGFSINGQASGLVNLCPGGPINTGCIQIGQNITTTFSQNFLDEETVTNDYQVTFYQADAALNIYGPPYLYQYYNVMTNVSQFSDPGQNIPTNDVNYWAAEAGLSLQAGGYYQIIISAAYFDPNYDPQSYSRFFHIMPWDGTGTVENIELTQPNYEAVSNLTLENDKMKSGDVSLATANSSVTIIPAAGPTTIARGASFQAFISPNLCQNNSSTPEKIVEAITLPNNFYNFSNDRTKYDFKPVIAVDHSLKVLPNPSNGEFSARLNSDVNFKTIAIFDMFGQTVYENNNATGTEISISLTPATAGVYILKAIDTNGKQYTKKIEIQ